MGNEGLQRLDRSTGQFTRLPSDPANPGKLSTPFLRSMPLDRQNLRQVLSILEDKNGWLWIGSMSGLDIYDPATGTVRHFETGKGAGSLPMNFLWNLSQSRDGIIWIGGGITGGKALKVHSDKPLFTFHNTSAFIVGLNDIQEDDSGNLWLAGGGLGPNKLVRYDRTSGQMRAVPLGETGSDHYNAFSIVQDPGGHIWACTQNGLYRIDPKTNAVVKHYRHQPNNPHSLSTDIITNILKDRRGYYWVTTWGGGLHRFDPKTEKFQRFLHDPAVPGSIGGNQTFGLYEDAQGNIWVGGGTEPYSDEKQNPMFLDGTTLKRAHLPTSGERRVRVCLQDSWRQKRQPLGTDDDSGAGQSQYRHRPNQEVHAVQQQHPNQLPPVGRAGSDGQFSSRPRMRWWSSVRRASFLRLRCLPCIQTREWVSSPRLSARGNLLRV
ncbi:MAG: hypothetical protein IPM98_03050 [Lewinellaceae bacterium]|nr:hypothetical protein [Lewinellaceae bacterium]